MMKFTVGLLGVAALATTVLLVLQQKQVASKQATDMVPAGEPLPTTISLERMRELGL